MELVVGSVPNLDSHTARPGGGDGSSYYKKLMNNDPTGGQEVKALVTLRDLYFCAALQGLCARDLRENDLGNVHISHAQVKRVTPYSVVTEANRIADESMRQREKGTK